jgi:hypothetical protein
VAKEITGRYSAALDQVVRGWLEENGLPQERVMQAATRYTITRDINDQPVLTMTFPMWGWKGMNDG